MKRVLLTAGLLIMVFLARAQVNVLWNNTWVFNGKYYDQVTETYGDSAGFAGHNYCSSAYYDNYLIATDGKGVYYNGSFRYFDDTTVNTDVPAYMAKIVLQTGEQFIVVVKGPNSSNQSKIYVLDQNTFSNWSSSPLSATYTINNVTGLLGVFYNFTTIPTDAFENLNIVFSRAYPQPGVMIKIYPNGSGGITMDSVNVNFLGRSYTQLAFDQHNDTVFFAGVSSDTLIYGYLQLSTNPVNFIVKNSNYNYSFSTDDHDIQLLGKSLYFLNGSSIYVLDLNDVTAPAQVVATSNNTLYDLLIAYDGSLLAISQYTILKVPAQYPVNYAAKNTLENYFPTELTYPHQFVPDVLYPLYRPPLKSVYLVNDSVHLTYQTYLPVDSSSFSLYNDVYSYFSDSSWLYCFLARPDNEVDLYLSLKPNLFFTINGDTLQDLNLVFNLKALSTADWVFRDTTDQPPDFYLRINDSYTYDFINWYYNDSLTLTNSVSYHVTLPGYIKVQAVTDDNVELVNLCEVYYDPLAQFEPDSVKIYYSTDSTNWFEVYDSYLTEDTLNFWVKVELNQTLPGLTYHWLINGQLYYGQTVKVTPRHNRNFIDLFVYYNGDAYVRHLYVDKQNTFMEPLSRPVIGLFDTVTRYVSFLGYNAPATAASDTVYIRVDNRYPYQSSYQDYIPADSVVSLDFGQCFANYAEFAPEDIVLWMDYKSADYAKFSIYLAYEGSDTLLLYQPPALNDTAIVVVRKPLFFTDTASQTLAEYISSLAPVDTVYWYDRLLTGEIYVVDYQYFKPEETFATLPSQLGYAGWKLYFTSPGGFSNAGVSFYSSKVEMFTGSSLAYDYMDFQFSGATYSLTVNEPEPNVFSIKNTSGNYGDGTITFALADDWNGCIVANYEFPLKLMSGSDQVLWNGALVIDDRLFDLTDTASYAATYLDKPGFTSLANFGDNLYLLSRSQVCKASKDLTGSFECYELSDTADTVAESPVMLKLWDTNGVAYLVPVVASQGNLNFYLISPVDTSSLGDGDTLTPAYTVSGSGNILSAFYPQTNNKPDFTIAYIIFDKNGQLSTAKIRVDNGSLVVSDVSWLSLPDQMKVSAFAPVSPYVYVCASNSDVYVYRFALDAAYNIQEIAFDKSYDIGNVTDLQLATGSNILYFTANDSLYALNLSTDKVSTFEAYGVKSLFLTPFNQLLAIGYNIYKISDINHPDLARTDLWNWANYPVFYNYPSGCFPVVWIDYAQDTIRLYEPVSFSFYTRYPDLINDVLLYNNLGDTAYNSLDFEVSQPAFSVYATADFYSSQVYSNTGIVGLKNWFSGKNNYLAAFYWPEWPDTIICIDTPEVTLAIPDYSYTGVRWFYNGQQLTDFDGLTEIVARKPGEYYVEAQFQDYTKTENTLILFKPELLFDSIDISFAFSEVQRVDTFQGVFQVILPETDTVFNIGFVIDDPDGILADRTIEPYFIVDRKKYDQLNISVPLNFNGEKVILAGIKYLNKNYLRPVKLIRTAGMVSFGDTLRLRYDKSLDLVLNHQKIGYSQDSSRYYVLLNDKKMSYTLLNGSYTSASVTDYNGNIVNADYTFSEADFLYYDNQPLESYRYAALQVNNGDSVYLVKDHPDFGDSVIIVFDYPAVFSFDGPEPFTNIFAADPQPEEYFFENTVADLWVYHIPFGVYYPEQSDVDPGDTIDLIEYLYFDSLQNSVLGLSLQPKNTEPVLKSFDVQDMDYLLSVIKQNDTVYTITPFKLLQADRGNLVVYGGDSSSYSVTDTIPYMILLPDKISKFGGNVLLTPNGDGKNDVVRLLDMIEFLGLNLSNLKITILDSKGHVLLKSKNVDLSSEYLVWNGEINGRQLPSGVYWVLVSDGQRFYYFTVTLIR